MRIFNGFIGVALVAGMAVVGLAPKGAHATVVGGAVTGGVALTNGGVFQLLVGGAGLTVGSNNQQSYNLFAFDEDQNITVAAPVAVNVGTSPVAGDVVASHYVFYDAPGLSAKRQTGYVDFDADIYGVATRRSTLDASDYLANNAVTYLSPSLRGLEGGDFVGIDPNNTKRLLVDWAAGSPGDYVRVFTMRSPIADNPPTVPLPAAAWMLLAGLGALLGLRRRA